MHTPAHRHILHIFLALILSAAVSSSVHAQVTNDEAQRRAQQEAERQEQRARQQRQLQERRTQHNAPDARLPAEQHQPESGDGALPGETPCFTINALQLAVPTSLPDAHRNILSNTLLPDPLAFAQTELDRYVGLCIGQQGINLIIKRLTNTALSKGYSTTRFGVSQQDLSKGSLTITVIPGIIRQIRFKDTSIDGSWKSAFPARPGDLLNLRDLEQGLEQMKRVTSQDADMQIVPGAQPGESDIVINVTRQKPWSASFNLDNSGSKGTGKYQLGSNFGYDNLLGINDVLMLGLTSNADITQKNHHTKNASLSYWVPYGYWTFGLSANYAKYKQSIAGEVANITSQGDTINTELTVQHLFHRNQSQKNSVQFKAGKRWGHAYVNNTELDNQKRQINFIELGLIHVHYMGQAKLDLMLAQRWGKGIGLLATVDSGRQGRYTMQTADASLSVPFRLGTHPLSYTSTLHGQSSPDALYAAEQLSLGSRYSVRGFDEEFSLSAEKGLYWRNELNAPLGNTGQTLYTGLDVGKLYGPNVANLAGNTLSGAVIGVRGYLMGASYDVAAGMPVYKPKAFSTHSPTLTFNLAYGF